jgi:hypothetical protein
MRYNLESMLPIGAFEHCGDRRIKLYGGGGSWNPVNIVEDAFSSVGDVLADIDPGPAIGSGLAEVDDFVNDEIPGGWVLPAAVAVAATTGYVDPTMFGAEAAFTGATETGLATLAGEGALAETVGATLLAGGEGFAGLTPELAAELGLYGESGLGIEGFFGDPLSNFYGLEGFGEIPMELLPEMIPEGIPLDPGISIEEALGEMPFEAQYPGDAQYEAQDIMEQARSTDVKPGSPTSWDRGVDPLFTPKDLLTAARVGSSLSKVLAPPRASATRTPSSFMPTSRSTLASTTPLSRYLAQSGFSDASMPSGSSGSIGGALPGNLRETSLAAAPVTQGPSMNLNQLKQLYPQLSNVDPRILNMLTGKQSSSPSYFTYSGDQGGGTSFTSTAQGGLPTAGIPPVASDRSAQTKFAGASPMGGYSALNSAGLQAINTGALPGMNTYGLKDGGKVHIPEFKTGTTGHFVQGRGDGQSDDIPAMLADGEYVFDADTVAALGNGSSKAGALQLDKMRESIRKHKRSAPHDKIPPKAKSPLEYLKG